MKCYLVGGAVRDLLLGRLPSELDYAFEGDSNAFIQVNPEARKVGRDISVIILHGREYMPLSGDGPASDLLRRDLTVNALALDENGRLFAHPSALHDLRAGILRLAAPDALLCDPLRVFRLARFAARFPDFSVHDSALKAMREIGEKGLLKSLPAERVGRELMKALAAPKPSRFLDTLFAARCLHPWFQECAGMDNIPAGPSHFCRGTTLEHTGRVMDDLCGDPLAVWTALAHDLGKVSTSADMLPHHYGHEERGKNAAATLAERLALPALYMKAGMTTADLHMLGGSYPRLRTGTKRDLLVRIHSSGLDEPFWKLVNADSGKNIRETALRDLRVVLSVKLPEELRDKGKASGERLRLLQCEALQQLYASTRESAFK